MAITIEKIIGNSEGNPDSGLTARNKINSNFQNLVDAILSIQVESGTTSFENLTDKPSTLQGYGITDAASSVHSHEFSAITNKPTTLAGYGITDAASSSHVHTFESLTNKPTTLSGYGIVDTYNNTQIDSLLSNKLNVSVFNDLFEKENVGTAEEPVYVIKAKYSFYSIGGVSALGNGSVGGGSTGLDYNALQVLLTSSENAYNINAAFLGTIDKTYITGKLGTEYSLSTHGHNLSTLNNDAGFIYGNDSRLSDARVASDVYAWAKASVKPSYEFSEIGSKPTTLEGYGVDKSKFIYSDHGLFGTNELTTNGYQSSLNRSCFWRDNNIGATGLFVSHSDSSNYGFAIYKGYHNNDNLVYRSKTDGSWGEEKTIWDSANSNIPTVDWNVHNLYANSEIYLNNKVAIQGGDNWLRLNNGNAFTDGIYCGNSIFRTDGALQIGPDGSKFIINTDGNAKSSGSYVSVENEGGNRFLFSRTALQKIGFWTGGDSCIASYSDMLFKTGHQFDDVTYGTEKMRLTSGGNMLIGTTIDSGYKLDVAGNGRFTDALYTDNNIYVGGPLNDKAILVRYIVAHNNGALAISPYGGNVSIGASIDSGYKLDIYGTLATRDIIYAYKGLYVQSEYGTCNVVSGNGDADGVNGYYNMYIGTWNSLAFKDNCYNTIAGYISAREGNLYMRNDIRAGGKVRIGNAELVYDAANNALYVQNLDGSSLNFYATGGVAALGYSGIVGGNSGLDYTALQSLLTGSENAYNINLAFLGNINQSYITNTLAGTYAISGHVHNQYVDLSNTQAIAGEKSFNNNAIFYDSIIATTGRILGESGTASLDGIPFHGIVMGHSGVNQWKFGEYGGIYNFYQATSATANATLIASITSLGITANSFVANSFVKNGGTSSQFLKADGSVDGTNYSVSTHTHGLMSDKLHAPDLIDGLTASNFRTTIFGNSSAGYNISTARWNTTPNFINVLGLSAYGTAIAWSGLDTHGFLALNYYDAGAVIGGGYGDNINWTAKLWHSGNFNPDNKANTSGTYSGLNVGYSDSAGYATNAGNAYNLGGVDRTRFIYGSSYNGTDQDYTDLDKIWKSGFYDCYNWTNAPIGGWGWVMKIAHRSNNDGGSYNYGTELFGENNVDGGLWYRNQDAYGAGTWRKIIDSGNIASQSVSYAGNADMLDGYHASSFVLTSDYRLTNARYNPYALTFTGYASAVYDGSNAVTVALPTKVSQLTNDSGYLTAITKAQVEGVLTGTITSHTHYYAGSASVGGKANAVANQLTFSGYSTLSYDGSTAVTIPIPNNTSQLTNGAGFITSSASITGNAATATKLATARTLWGQSFDGSVNVTGALTSVTDITMSGKLLIGSAQFIYDAANNAIYVQKADGSAANFYATGGVSALGFTAGATLSNDIIFANSGTTTRQIQFNVGDNDYARIAAGAVSTNAGWLEIATADDGTEPIYVRQYSGAFGTIVNQVTLLDSFGNTVLANSLNLLNGNIFKNHDTNTFNITLYNVSGNTRSKISLTDSAVNITGAITSTGAGTFNGGSFSSLRKLKNIHDDWKGNALNEITKFKIRDFNYKNQTDCNRTLGFIVDEIPETMSEYVLANKAQDAINLYTLHALSFKAHQETKSEIDILKEKVANLEHEIIQLRSQLNN